MINEIKTLCYSNGKLVPKRNLQWLEKHNTVLFQEIIKSFPGASLPQVIVFLENGITKIEDVPKCHCGKPVIVYRNKLLEVCSNKCSIKSAKTQNKTRRTCMDKYGTERKWGGKKYQLGEHPLQYNYKNLDDIKNPDIMEDLSNKTWEDVAKHFGLSLNSHSSAFKFMEKHGYPIKSMSGKSGLEQEVYDYICSLGVSCEQNTKQIILPYELDIYVPSHSLAIEFNGVYWHSSNSKEDDKRLYRYHLNKTELCESKGINLLHIFENEWNDPVKKEIWKSVIKNKLGLSKRIYARKCSLKKIDKKIANNFIEENHLQGKCPGSIYKGLFYNDELVQVAVLGKSRYNKEYDLELLRLCSKAGYTVVGGASKLLKGLIYISYANRRWSQGNVYNKLGLKYIGTSEPCYYYIVKGKLYHRSSFMKHKLKDKLLDFNPKLTEVENCYNNGLRRIWDCGNYIYAKL